MHSSMRYNLEVCGLFIRNLIVKRAEICVSIEADFKNWYLFYGNFMIGVLS